MTIPNLRERLKRYHEIIMELYPDRHIYHNTWVCKEGRYFEVYRSGEGGYDYSIRKMLHPFIDESEGKEPPYYPDYLNASYYVDTDYLHVHYKYSGEFKLYETKPTDEILQMLETSLKKDIKEGIEIMIKKRREEREKQEIEDVFESLLNKNKIPDDPFQFSEI